MDHKVESVQCMGPWCGGREHRRAYSERYDAYYDVDTRIWCERVCPNPVCPFCAGRPDAAPHP